MKPCRDQKEDGKTHTPTLHLHHKITNFAAMNQIDLKNNGIPMVCMSDGQLINSDNKPDKSTWNFLNHNALKQPSYPLTSCRTPIRWPKWHFCPRWALEIMHPLELIMNRQHLPTDMIGMGKIWQQSQNILEGSFGVDHHTTIKTSSFIKHRYFSLISYLAKNASVRLSWSIPKT